MQWQSGRESANVEDRRSMSGPLVIGGHGPRPNAPGQLASHYAPMAPMRLAACDVRPGEVRLGFGAGPSDLNQRQLGKVRALAKELGVNRIFGVIEDGVDNRAQIVFGGDPPSRYRH